LCFRSSQVDHTFLRDVLWPYQALLQLIIVLVPEISCSPNHAQA
jgi:hypothetical protein